MHYSWYDLVGNIGVATIVITYLLLQLNKIDSVGLAYSLFNGLGASLVIVSLLFEFNISAFAIEFFWLLISVVGIARYYVKKRGEI
jgi:multidrug transporter EmrE-like cation transporter